MGSKLERKRIDLDKMYLAVNLLFKFLPGSPKADQPTSEKEHGRGFGEDKKAAYFFPLVTIFTESMPVMLFPSSVPSSAVPVNMA